MVADNLYKKEKEDNKFREIPTDYNSLNWFCRVLFNRNTYYSAYTEHARSSCQHSTLIDHDIYMVLQKYVLIA